MRIKERYPLLTECCGNPPKGNGDVDTADLAWCPYCKDHTRYGYFDSDGNFFETQLEAMNSDLENERQLLTIK